MDAPEGPMVTRRHWIVIALLAYNGAVLVTHLLLLFVVPEYDAESRQDPGTVAIEITLVNLCLIGALIYSFLRRSHGTNYDTAGIGAGVAVNVGLTVDHVVVQLADGRSLSVPLAWYPRLLHGSQSERQNWRILGGGYAIEWPDLDEHIGVEGLLAGRHSGESEAPFQQWLTSRHSLP